MEVVIIYTSQLRYQADECTRLSVKHINADFRNERLPLPPHIIEIFVNVTMGLNKTLGGFGHIAG